MAALSFVAILVLVAVGLLVRPPLGGDTTDAGDIQAGPTTSGAPAQSPDVAPSVDAAAPQCTQLAVVTASSFTAVLEGLRSDLSTGPDCVDLAVTTLDGKQAVDAMDACTAHVWIPDDVSWVSGASQACLGPPPAKDGPPPVMVAASPIVIAVGATVATGLGPDGATWLEMADLAMAGAPPTFVSADPKSCGEGLVGNGGPGEASWAVTGMDDASGVLSAVHAKTQSATCGVAPDIGSDQVAFVAEHSLVARGGPIPGAVLLGATDATTMLRYTWMPTLTGVGDPGVDKARERLLSGLTGPAAAGALNDAGLRTPDLAALPGIDWLPAVTAPPSPPLGRHHVEHVFAAWYREDRMADHLMVVDVSTSMWARSVGGGESLLEDVKLGVNGVADNLPDSARFGVWEFGTELNGLLDHRVAAQPAELSPGHRQTVASAVGAMTPLNTGTGLYDTILASYLEAQASQRPGIRSHLLVFTDGKNEGDPGSLTVEQLGAALSAAADPARPVNLAVVVYGPEAETVIGPLADHLKDVKGYVAKASTATEVVNIFAHVAAGGLHS